MNGLENICEKTVADPNVLVVCCRPLAGIASSNPAAGVGVCLLCVLCVIGQMSLRRADHPFRGVLPSVTYHCVWTRNLNIEVALARVGLLRQKKKPTQKPLLWESQNKNHILENNWKREEAKEKLAFKGRCRLQIVMAALKTRGKLAGEGDLNSPKGVKWRASRVETIFFLHLNLRHLQFSY